MAISEGRIVQGAISFNLNDEVPITRWRSREIWTLIEAGVNQNFVIINEIQVIDPKQPFKEFQVGLGPVEGIPRLDWLRQLEELGVEYTRLATT